MELPVVWEPMPRALILEAAAAVVVVAAFLDLVMALEVAMVVLGAEAAELERAMLEEVLEEWAASELVAVAVGETEVERPFLVVEQELLDLLIMEVLEVELRLVVLSLCAMEAA